MEWRIARCGDSRVIAFAAGELARYIKLMDPEAEVAFMVTGPEDAVQGAVSLCAGSRGAPEVCDPELDDGYAVDISGGSGIIAGTNERSVLLGVYRYLGELGCRWVRPGKDGEYVPRTKPEGKTVRIKSAASYRHRGVCIEGAVSASHVLNMVDWMPKAGLNSYFIQFFVPYTFYDRWYSHQGNPYMEGRRVSLREVLAMTAAHIEEIKNRGLVLHGVGHGWTCEPFGIEGSGWDVKEYPIPPGVKEMLAEVDGKRELWGGIPLNTNLCYSNPKVTEGIVNSVREYCLANPAVDYVHLWLADGMNNHCECENCRDTLPSDYYVRLLNAVDGALTAAGVKTRVVFLIYVDLLWAPERERLNNPDRFTLMYAPITRTFSSSFASSLGDAVTEPLPAYVRNRLEMPRSVGGNIARLRDWQAQFSGDGFDFDYHLMWAHNTDLSGWHIAKVLFEDMKSLGTFGLNGMVSCQVQRAFFPSGLAMGLMAAALWDKDLTFEEAARAHLTSVYGDDAEEMERYFSTLSELMDPPFQRGECEPVSERSAALLDKVPGTVMKALPLIRRRAGEALEPSVKKTWEYLEIHAQLFVMTAAAFAEKARGESDRALRLWEEAAEFLRRMEPEIHEALDVHCFLQVVGGIFEKRGQGGS